MAYYKLGCNWGSGKPDFYEMLKKHSIVICADHGMRTGDFLAITRGYEVIAIAQMESDRIPCTNFPDLQGDFQVNSINYEDWNTIAKAKIWEIPKQDRFQYQLQQGICQIQNPEIIGKVNALIRLFMGQQIIEDSKKLLLGNYNIVLTGAPGTGKTFLAKEIAESMGAEWKIVQFHPSYDYTDFVEGLRPIKKDENLGFERKDGVFKEFCKEALRKSAVEPVQALSKFKEDLEVSSISIPCFKDSKRFITIKLNEKGEMIVFPQNSKRPDGYKCSDLEVLDYLNTGKYDPRHDTYQPSIGEYVKKQYIVDEIKEGEPNLPSIPYVFIIDEINRGEISKIFGELFYSIDSGYRGTKGRVHTQYQNLIPKTDLFYEGFYIPENVYIIGTMNDIDRSVESMDFAMRRRFAWKEITAESRQSMLDDEKAWDGNKPKQEVIDEIKTRMNNLNACIIDQYGEEKLSPKDKIGLTKAYQIGASYFLKLGLYNNNFDELWKNHLEGLLFEYLRGTTNIEAKIERLHMAFNDKVVH